MERSLRLEWKHKLAPKLITLPGVNGVEIGTCGLIVRVEKQCPQVDKVLEDFFEREAPDIAYATKSVGRTVRISDDPITMPPRLSRAE